MKLAEALQERADLNRKIEQLDSRLCNNCLVQEGEKPLENPEELLQELEYSVGRLEYLMERINITNSKTLVDGKTMTACIARKDALILKQRVLRNIIEEASQNTHRATRTEIIDSGCGKDSKASRRYCKGSSPARQCSTGKQLDSGIGRINP